MRRNALTALVLIGACATAQADVYRWVDEHGVAHYSDEWVPGSEVIKTGTPRPPGASGAAPRTASRSLAPSGAGSADNPGAANLSAVEKDVAAQRAAQCKQATAAYNKAITARVIYKDGPDGQRQFLSEADADKYRADARQAVQDYCGSVPKFDPEAPLNPQPQPVTEQPAPEPKVNPALATSE